jgi:mannosyltransferase
MSKERHKQEQIRRWILMVVLCGLAFVLRITYLDRQSIWYDEGLSIYYTQGSLGQVLQAVSQSDHPPLHTVMLKLWMALCGDSEFSVRMLSVWWALIAIALLYRLANQFSPSTGWIAALLMALSPFGIWYAQETRGYTMALALVTGAAVGAFQLISARRRPSVWAYVLYGLCALAALYTHFYSGFVLLALNFAYVVLRLRLILTTRPGRVQLGLWILTQVLVLAAFAPWIPFVAAQLQVNATYWHGAVGWRQIVRRTLTAFAVGDTLSDGWAVACTWVMSLWAGLGLAVLATRQRDRPSALTLSLWILVPTIVLIAINRSRPKFSPRYLMNALPPFLILCATGVRQLFQTMRQRLPTWQGGVTAIFLLVSTGIAGGATARSLGNHYLDQSLYRPDFRAVTQYIEQHAGPDDLIVLVGGHSYPAFDYYYDGSLPVVPMPDKLLPTTQHPIDLKSLKIHNEAIVGRQTLWLVLWQESLADPTGLVMDEIEQTYHRLGVGREFHQIALLAFDVSPGPLLTDRLAPVYPMVADLGDQVRFLGYDLPVRTAHPGDTLYLYLYWEALPGVSHDYKVFTQLLDDDNQIVAQNDKIAGAEAYPTSHWTPGYTVRDRFLLTIRPDAPAGSYRLIAGLYSPGASLTRLPVQGQGAQGDHILLAEVELQAE